MKTSISLLVLVFSFFSISAFAVSTAELDKLSNSINLNKLLDEARPLIAEFQGDEVAADLVEFRYDNSGENLLKYVVGSKYFCKARLNSRYTNSGYFIIVSNCKKLP